MKKVATTSDARNRLDFKQRIRLAIWLKDNADRLSGMMMRPVADEAAAALGFPVHPKGVAALAREVGLTLRRAKDVGGPRSAAGAKKFLSRVSAVEAATESLAARVSDLADRTGRLLANVAEINRRLTQLEDAYLATPPRVV